MNNPLKRLILLSLLIALSLAISLLEMTIPLPIAIPGAKLGLSNIIILVSLSLFDFKSAIIVSVLKSFLLMLVTGQVSAFLYSLTGAIFSTTAMLISLKFVGNHFSLIGVSEIGSFFHNLGQIIVAALMLSNIKIFYYFPILILVSIFTGIFVGFSSDIVLKHLRKIDIGIINE